LPVLPAGLVWAGLTWAGLVWAGSVDWLVPPQATAAHMIAMAATTGNTSRHLRPRRLPGSLDLDTSIPAINGQAVVWVTATAFSNINS